LPYHYQHQEVDCQENKYPLFVLAPQIAILIKRL
jgi:hypothetical protein